MNLHPFLPLTMEEARQRGWNEIDIVCVTGDAYVDHPSFGIAITARLLESLGFRVAMVCQPQRDEDFLTFGAPKLGFFVTSGNIDSMVNNYTAARRKRTTDVYSPAGKAGMRPDRAVIVYCNKIRELLPQSVIVIGGLEASLRRFAHYDYWDDAVRPSILVDSKADLLIYGMGEHQTEEIARGLAAGKTPAQLREIRGICYLAELWETLPDAVSCASFAKVSADKTAYAKAFQLQLEQQDSVYGKAIQQKHGDKLLVQTPPAIPLNQQELDKVFEIPFRRTYHPVYESQGGIPAISEVEFSIMHNRGCFGDCNFCSITFHQGRHVTCRSHESILREAKSFLDNPHFKGYIHDVGGPTANFRLPSCKKQLTAGLCKNRKCLAPKPCPNLQVDHSDYVELLRKLRAIPGIKRVFIRSGIRYDYLMEEKDPTFFQELVRYHVSGQLKVAPEHCSNHVLNAMGKPHIETYERFAKRFYDVTKQAGKEQYLVPYLISSHPGSTLADAIELAVFLKKNKIHPEQVQDFYPTPGTPSTCMFYTGLDPATLKPVFVPRTPEEKHLQRVLLQYYKPENRSEVIRALIKGHREDLIGTEKHCLVPPDREYLQRKNRQRAERKPLGGKTNRRSAVPGRSAAGQQKAPTKSTAKGRSGGHGTQKNHKTGR